MPGPTPGVWNVSDPFAPFEITGGVVAPSGGGVSIRFGSDSPALSGWHVAQDSAFISVPSASITSALASSTATRILRSSA